MLPPMSNISKGVGGDLSSIARRVGRIEALLSNFTRQTIIAKVLGFNSPRQMDALVRIGGEGSDNVFPFGGAILGGEADGTEDKIVFILGGWVQVGPAGEYKEIEEKKSSGTYVYLCIKQDVNGAVADMDTDITIEFTDTEKAATNLDATAEFVEWSNVLLAEVGTEVIDGVTTNVVRQRRTGNFILTTWAIDGYAALWPDTTGGNI